MTRSAPRGSRGPWPPAICLLPVLLVSAVIPALAYVPTLEPLPTAVVPSVAQAPVVDGKLAEATWQAAATLGPFVTMEGAASKGSTSARVLRSGDTLYIGVQCATEAGAQLKVTQSQRDSEVYTDESVEVFLDPGVTLQRYYHLLVSAANVQRDESGDKGATPGYDVGWDATWHSATEVKADGWTVEMAIPLTELGLPAGAGALAGLNVCRNDTARQESTCWSPTQSGFHEPARFGLVSLSAEEAPTAVAIRTVGSPKLGLGDCSQRLRLRAVGRQATGLEGLLICGNEASRIEETVAVPELPADRSRGLALGWRADKPGSHAVALALRTPDGSFAGLWRGAFSLPEVPTEGFGYRLAGGGALGLWWAEGLYKVHRNTAMPQAREEAVRLSLAGNEYEAFQLVVRPQEDVAATLTVSDFSGPGGTIPAEEFKLLQVDYVPVSIPTDRFGWKGEWPDPLPEPEGATVCTAGRNQPFWVLAHAPAGTRPGEYRGTVTVSTPDTETQVPVRLRVYGFSLTDETHISTAYGVTADNEYLALGDPEQRKLVHDLYMQSCRDHRISPYDPMRYYPIKMDLGAPQRRITTGRLTVQAQQGQESPWTLYWDGREIACQRTSMTHFEKEGVGWQGSGVSWPYVDGIVSVEEVGRTPTLREWEVVAACTSSSEASRSYKLTFRLYIPAGDDWFGMRLVQMESTDPVEVEVREYFNLPRTTFAARQVANGPGFAAWSDDTVGFGMLCLDGKVGGLSIAEGRDRLTVSNAPAERFRIKQGETHEGWGPLVVYFATDKVAAEDLAARAQELASRIDPEAPETYQPAAPVQLDEQIKDDYSVSHDFSLFDEGARRYLDEFKFNAFNMSCMPGQIGGHPRFTPEYKRLHRLLYGPVIEHLRDNGWLQKAYSYWYDEPEESAYPHVVEGMELLGRNCPGLTRLITEQPEPGLMGPIDLWVPVLEAYKPQDCQARQAEGELVWWYVCCGPRAPYPNNFVDHPAINHRIRFCMAQKYGVTGSLYWATTFYGHMPDGTPRNPWEDAMTYRPNGGYWGNGDGMLLYPATRKPSEEPVLEGPVVSLRWEVLRDGIEDYEYIWTLRQEMARLEGLRAQGGDAPAISAALEKAREALGALDRLAESLTVYTKDPQDLLRERQAIAEAVEACMAVR